MTDTMTDTHAAEVLAAHNEWRRYDGETGEPGAPAMGDPAELGRAIDHAVSRLRSQPPAEAQAVYAGVDLEGGWIRATAPEAQAQVGGEVAAWRILWSPQFPETAELTSDGVRVQKVRALDDGPQIEPLYTAPPSAPVGVEGLRRCGRCEREGDSGDCERCGGTGWRRKCADPECAENGCCHGRTCYVSPEEVAALAQQPAAVDGAQSEAIRARRQQIAGWLEGLSQAARSLRTIAEQAGRTEGMEDMQNVRGYANSRATVAEAALGFQQGGRSDV